MRDFPSCFGESGVQVADANYASVASSKSSQNCVTCIYKCKLFGKSCLISIVWGKNLMGQCLSVEIDDESHNFLCKMDIKLSLFSKKKGSKCLDLNSCKIEVFWDLSLAKFGSGPEPLGLYYIGIVCRGEMVFVIGDLIEKAFKKTGAIASLSRCVLVYRRENIFGKNVFCTKARFCEKGQIHDLKIECDTSHCTNNDPVLVVRVNSKPVMLVKNLQWKFRGNCTIELNDRPVEVFWDVHNWLFGSSLGNAVFMFRTSLEVEKAGFDSSVVPWRCSGSFEESMFTGLGCSLILYAWKSE